MWKPSRLKSLRSTLCVVVLRNIWREERRQMNAGKGMEKSLSSSNLNNMLLQLYYGVILYYCAPKAPNKVMHTQTQNVPLFSKRGKMMLKCLFLPCHWHVLITGVLGVLQTSPSPLPIDFGQGQAQTAGVLAWPTHPYTSNILRTLDWKDMTRIEKI